MAVNVVPLLHTLTFVGVVVSLSVWLVPFSPLRCAALRWTKQLVSGNKSRRLEGEDKGTKGEQQKRRERMNGIETVCVCCHDVVALFV